MLDRIEKQGFEYVMFGMGIVVLWVLVTNSGGVTQLVKTLFNGVNATYGTLLNRSPQTLS